MNLDLFFDIVVDELVLYRYSRNNWIFFQVIGLFLLLISGFQTMKPRHVDKSSKHGETTIILTKNSCKRKHHEN